MDMMIPGKIRKRGCSSSASSSSSVINHNYRFKRAILVGKRGGGSTTPVPTWKLLSSRSPASAMRILESPRYPPPPSQSGSKSKQAPVSARKLAATLWEMNEIPSPSVKEMRDHVKMKKEVKTKDRGSTARSIRSGSLPPHLSDPSHTPPSEVSFLFLFIVDLLLNIKMTNILSPDNVSVWKFAFTCKQ